MSIKYFWPNQNT
ncbi:hypothetical protein FWK35_00028056 [Aphis craccivora]|uniref:Uncharacterized protein n=1 Tax=Aphis craccivora TaxID=307492 RepID=A0A6G0YGG4_APHCR|nr:hypothetical protein FWK35_00028056 [Aphis craccivora]